jgi:nucleoside-diphosphate-sugar epimerase
VKQVLIAGAGGFIGSHLVKRLKYEGCWESGVFKYSEFSKSPVDDFLIGVLREKQVMPLAQVFNYLSFIYFSLLADLFGNLKFL